MPKASPRPDDGGRRVTAAGANAWLEGMLLQLDGSRHHWLGPDLPKLSLVGAIDDATSKVPAATFRNEEDAAGYLEIMREVALCLRLTPVADDPGPGWPACAATSGAVTAHRRLAARVAAELVSTLCVRPDGHALALGKVELAGRHE